MSGNITISVFSSDGSLDRVVNCPESVAELQTQDGEHWVFGDYGRANVYLDGQWVVQPKGDAASPWHRWDTSAAVWLLDLDAAKADRWAAIKTERDLREFGKFVWSGHSFDGDRDSQRRLNLALMKAKAAFDAGEDWSIDWTLADNTVLTLSAADLIAVVQALGDNIDAAHEWARVKRAQIEAASNLDEVLAVS